MRECRTSGSVRGVPSKWASLPRWIDDITTDTDNPPTFIAVVKLREAEDGNPSTYAGAETAALQKRSYHDLASLSLALAPEKAFPIALATAKKMSWTIIEADPTTRASEAFGWASPTTSSSGSPRRIREAASTYAPLRAMGAAILASTLESVRTSRLFTRRRSQATKGTEGSVSLRRRGRLDRECRDRDGRDQLLGVD